MRQIFVFTAGDKNARAHLKDSILKPVPFSWLDEELGQEEAGYYRSLIPEGEGFYAWGAVPGPVNQRTWGAMQVGDLVLTVYDNQYHFFSSVIGKFIAPELASRIWGVDDNGKTWEYMYLLSKPQEVAVGVLDQSVVNHLNRGYRGFTRISDEKVNNILVNYDSLDQFFEQVFRCSIPLSHVERELKRAEEEAEGSVLFDPLNMVDGRQKVVRELIRRQGQPQFRKKLLRAYAGKCVVTGCHVTAVLEAAHIAPYFGAESNAVQNGLLLRADIHTLFDLGKLKITPEGKVELHEELLGTDYKNYEGITITPPNSQENLPSSEALTLKYNLVL